MVLGCKFNFFYTEIWQERPPESLLYKDSFILLRKRIFSNFLFIYFIFFKNLSLKNVYFFLVFSKLMGWALLFPSNIRSFSQGWYGELNNLFRLWILEPEKKIWSFPTDVVGLVVTNVFPWLAEKEFVALVFTFRLDIFCKNFELNFEKSNFDSSCSFFFKSLLFRIFWRFFNFWFSEDGRFSWKIFSFFSSIIFPFSKGYSSPLVWVFFKVEELKPLKLNLWVFVW